MSETFLVLERAVEADLDTIARLYAEIGQPDLPEDAPQDKLIVLSYRLHNLYNAFENIFRNVTPRTPLSSQPSGALPSGKKRPRRVAGSRDTCLRKA